MRKLFLISLLFFIPLKNAVAKDVWVTLDQDAIKYLSNYFPISTGQNFQSNDGIVSIKISEKKIPFLSHLMHEKFNRCGGFVYHESKTEAEATLNSYLDRDLAVKGMFDDYAINQSAEINPLIAQVEEGEIRTVIEKLSSYHNRHYQSKTGVEAVKWIKDHWAGLTSNRSDVKVEYFSHKWKQKSVILTIEGSERPDEIIVIGGHADSIGSGFWDRKKSKAPGADDNASGIATITEMLRILVKNNYKPERTIKLMAYSAEEVGLKGSKEIASKFKRDKKNVVGVIQFDMTNHNGSDWKITLIDDHTNKKQNQFLAGLIDTYVKVPWGYSKCGYACSDHASWTNNGYPASFPFESKFNDSNKKIHSAKDTINVSRGVANHAVNFTKLGIAFVVEMDK